MLLLMDLSPYSSEITVQISFSVSDTGGDTQEREIMCDQDQRSSKGNPLQYSCLENSMDGGSWWATLVHGVAKSRTQLSDFTFHFKGKILLQVESFVDRKYCDLAFNFLSYSP